MELSDEDRTVLDMRAQHRRHRQKLESRGYTRRRIEEVEVA